MVALLLAVFVAVSGLARAGEHETFVFDNYELATALSRIHDSVGTFLVCPQGEAAASAVRWALAQEPSLEVEVLRLAEDGTGPESIEQGLARLQLACGVRVRDPTGTGWNLEGVGQCGETWATFEDERLDEPDEPFGRLEPERMHSPKRWGAGRVAGTVVLVVLGVGATVVVVLAVVFVAACSNGGCFALGAVGLRESRWPDAPAVSVAGPPRVPVLGFRW